MPAVDPHRSEAPNNAALSELLRSLCDGPPGPMRVRDIVDHFGHRAFGAVLFVFSVPNLLPLPPGSSTILGLPLVIIAPQLAIGARRPWLPRAVADRTVDRAALASAFSKLIPGLERVEKLLAPRLGFMFGAVGDRVIGLICFLLALVLILPIPLGNMMPAASVGVFSLSLTQRDGAFALLGYLLSLVSVGLLVLSAGAVWAAVEQLIRFFGG
jgi:hypothetical protein